MHAIAVYLDGTDAPDEADDGTPLLDDDFLILVNAYWEPVTFTIPPVRETPQTWFVELDSYDPAVSAARVFPKHTGDPMVARPRSLPGPARPKIGMTPERIREARKQRPVGHRCMSISGKGTWPPDKGDYTRGSHRPRFPV